MIKTGSIYALIDPRDRSVRYVGQTIVALQKRLSDHLSAPTNSKMRSWLGELKSAGLRPDIILLETASIDRLDERERAWLNEMFLRGERPFQYASADTLWEMHQRGIRPKFPDR